MSVEKVLLIKTSSLGDVVHTLPAVTDAVRTGIKLDWVVEEAFADIPNMHSSVRRVIPIAWRRWRRALNQSWREMSSFYRLLNVDQYDLVLDSQGLFKSAVIAACAKGRRVGFSYTSARESWTSFFYKQRIKVPTGGHAVDRQRALFATALGYDLQPKWQSGIEQQPIPSNKVFLLHGTTWPTKHWPVNMWLKLVEQLLKNDFKPLVTWGNDQEKIRATKLAVEGGASLVARRPLRELIEVLVSCGCVVTVDSGLGQLAAALGLPTIGLYGATSAALTGCRGQCVRLLQSSISCAPCIRKRCTQYRGPELVWQRESVDPPCFAFITPEKVFTAIKEIMRAAQ